MENNKKNIVTIVVAVTLLLVFVIGLTYAVFSFSGKGSRINQISTANITMNYTEAVNGITLTNSMPISDAAGVLLTGEDNTFYFNVSISTGNNNAVAYEIAAEKASGSTMSNSDVKLYLEKSSTGQEGSYSAVTSPVSFTPEESVTPIGTKAGEMVLDIGSSSTSTTIYYVLRMWVAESYMLTDTEKTFSVKVNVYGTDTVTIPSNISLNKNSTMITVGNSDTLTAMVTPNNASYNDITWTSSNTSVATVSNSGVVTGVAEGSAVITARTKNGKIATCNVTILFQSLVPILSSDTGSNGHTIYDPYGDNSDPAWYAFNDDITNYWRSNIYGKYGSYIGYYFNDDVIVKTIELMPGMNTNNPSLLTCIRTESVQYSDDGTNWNDVVEFDIAEIDWYNKTITSINLNHNSSHKYWRIFLKDATINTRNGFAYIQFYN